MKVTASMIERFFRNELNKYQAELVKAYFRQHPEVLKSYLTDKSWEDFTLDEQLDPTLSNKMFRNIAAGSYKRNNVKLIYIRWASVAAAIILISIGYYGWTSRKNAINRTSAVSVNKKMEVQHLWRDEINQGRGSMHLSLSDGSQVELAAGSKIRYLDSFTKDKRDIYLSGSALFVVGKDVKRPFTVFAGHLHVTALGTVFKVNTNDAQEQLVVRLLSGKVVVSPDSLLLERGMKDAYLDPGQSLLFDKQKLLVKLLRGGKDNGVDGRKPGAQAPLRVFAFDNKPLAAIFEELSAAYRIRFIYNKEQLKDLNFTGNFNSQKETLESFLNTVGVLNGLTIRIGKNEVHITQ